MAYENDEIELRDEVTDIVVKKATENAPNTVGFGALGLILGAALGGPLGGFIGATIGSLVGAEMDVES